MAEKMTCPACNAHLSSVRTAFLDGDPCPNCGLSAAAALEVIAAIERGADEALTESAAKANQRADVAEAQVRRLQRKVERIKRAVEEEPDDY
jgi:Zn-finger nucleic acid-binding protein